MSKISTIVRDLKFYYAKLDKPVEHKFNQTMIYDVQLRFPKERIEEMSAYGKVRQEEDGNYAINLTRNAVNAAGKKQTVRVVDANKEPIKDLIGNGSEGNAIVYSYPWTRGGNSGIKTIILAIQVTNLIKYEPNDIDFDIIEAPKATEAQVDF